MLALIFRCWVEFMRWSLLVFLPKLLTRQQSTLMVMFMLIIVKTVTIAVLHMARNPGKIPREHETLKQIQDRNPSFWRKKYELHSEEI